jgi:hypothetical protein
MSKQGVCVVGALGLLSFSEAVTAHICQTIELAESEAGTAVTTQSLCGRLEDVFTPHKHRDDESDEPTTLSYASASGGINLSAGQRRNSFTVTQPETRIVIRTHPQTFCGHLRSHAVPTVVIDAIGIAKTG